MFFPAAFSEWSPKTFLGYLIERDEFSCDRDNYFAADKVFLFFWEGVLTISVIVETDEINIAWDSATTENNGVGHDFKNTPRFDIFDAYLNKSLCFLWEGCNVRGYTDMLILGFNYFKPSVVILANGNELNIYTINGACK